MVKVRWTKYEIKVILGATAALKDRYDSKKKPVEGNYQAWCQHGECQGCEGPPQDTGSQWQSI